MPKDVETDLTLMQIYPHTDSRFHRFMGGMMVFLMPANIIVFPFLVFFKFMLYSLFYFLTLPIAYTKAYDKLWALKNFLLLPFHHTVYKISYIYITIWLNAGGVLFDDYWFGLDKKKYKDYDHFRSSYRRAVTRRRFREKLAAYSTQDITEEEVSSRISVYKILFSYPIFKIIKESCTRKKGDTSSFFLIFAIIREYYLLLFLPMQIRLYKVNTTVVALSSFLIRGNTLMICQCLIASNYTRAGIFYKTMQDLMEKAFGMEHIRFISSGPTANQSKKTSGYYPINFLLTDEFKFMPFSSIDVYCSTEFIKRDLSPR